MLWSLPVRKNPRDCFVSELIVFDRYAPASAGNLLIIQITECYKFAMEFFRHEEIFTFLKQFYRDFA